MYVGKVRVEIVIVPLLISAPTGSELAGLDSPSTVSWAQTPVKVFLPDDSNLPVVALQNIQSSSKSLVAPLSVFIAEAVLHP